MPTRWKVVNQNRTSPQVSGKYSKKYLKGTIVKANKGTLGLMTFKTEDQAEEWCGSVHQPKILKVRPIGRGKVPIVLANRDYLNLFYKHRRKLNTKKTAELVRHNHREGARSMLHTINGKDIILWPVPDGTICYPAVEVLE